VTWETITPLESNEERRFRSVTAYLDLVEHS
jgi:hypothetical protein